MTTLSEALQLASQHHRANRLDQAEQVYRQILETQPERVEVLYGLGVLERQRGKESEAEKMFQAVLRIQPESFKTWFSLGNLRQAQEHWSEAVSAYQRALAIRPQEAAIYNNLGYALQQQGNLEKAIAYYQKALEINPNCTEAEINWNNALPSQGNINSFDIFDTLIARFCIDPDEIFLQVEKKTNFQNFASYRKKAEHYLLKNTENYNLEDIYQRLAQDLNLDRCDIEDLKEAEVETEIQNVIGIKENLDKVKDGDLLVSDMYLPESVLRQMLHQAGLKKQVDLIVSAKGKHSGRAWDKIINDTKIAQHLGDNRHSDVHMALRSGIRAELYQSAQPSSVEKALIKIGAKSLARVIRKTRLANHFENPGQQNFYNCFIQGNLVILVAFSAFLLQIAKQNNIRRYWFSSRDCYHLHKIFRQITRNCESPVDCEYFFTSRLARVKCSDDYLSYLLHLLNQEKNSAVVDLAGTGLSLSYLFKKIDQNFSLPIVFFHHTNLGRVKKIYQDNLLNDTIFSLIPQQSQNLNIDALEILNYIKQPMIQDVLKQDENEYSPVFYPSSTSVEILELIDGTEKIIDDFSAHLNSGIVEEIIHGVDLEDLTKLSVAIYQQLCQNKDFFSYFMTFHLKENKKVEHELATLLAST
ncbi:tetratricopeptide repeat protein [Pleurocapsa sp. PCC 7319]|uniref:tetratricopeptide repeat protein n=1 Tax=Pleurocapsa sp. PCC 7319 TaxID=118161 RepID=UPI00034AE9F8|nr:tetratricopeptide repeat protein [Pleurocapsa sp. PCC 7319]